MEVSELRTLNADELKGKVKGWRDELFRTRFKVQSSEARDTSTVKKLRREIARALTVLTEKERGVVVASKPVEKREAKSPVEKAEKAPKAEKAASAKKATSKKATKASEDKE